MELPSYLTRPRPNGSNALRQSLEALEEHLRNLGVVPLRQPFTSRPYFQELVGLWLAAGGLLLPLAALARAGWVGLVLGLLIPLIPVLEVRFGIPTVSALLRHSAYNLQSTFPAPAAAQELILCAHVDTKTELLDHQQRRLLLRLSMPAAALAVASGTLVLSEQLVRTESAATALRWTAFAAALPACVFGLVTAADLVLGRLSSRPSRGAVDNGAATTVLLALAEALQRGTLRVECTSVTLLWTVAEEAQMQGAAAWVRHRHDWPVPTLAVNLEILGQSGSFVLWKHDGTALRRLATSDAINAGLAESVSAVTGTAPLMVADINSDAFAFLSRQIPAATLGSFDENRGDRGLHSHHDNPDRIVPRRLDEALEVLSHFLAARDRICLTAVQNHREPR